MHNPELELLASWLDDRFEIAGFKFGLGFFIELVPGIGDVVAPVLGLYLFVLALKYKTSSWTKVRMLLNIFVYFMVGLVPVAGDAFGAWFKPNRRNLKLLQNKLENA
jgi:hypothetical protein